MDQKIHSLLRSPKESHVQLNAKKTIDIYTNSTSVSKSAVALLEEHCCLFQMEYSFAWRAKNARIRLSKNQGAKHNPVSHSGRNSGPHGWNQRRRSGQDWTQWLGTTCLIGVAKSGTNWDMDVKFGSPVNPRKFLANPFGASVGMPVIHASPRYKVLWHRTCLVSLSMS